MRINVINIYKEKNMKFQKPITKIRNRYFGNQVLIYNNNLVVSDLKDILDLNNLLYSNCYDDASMTKTVLFVTFFSKRTGFPILPTRRTSTF